MNLALVGKSFHELRFGLVSLFNDISTFVGYYAKPFLIEKQRWYYLTYNWRNKRVHTYLKFISPKVNVIERLEFELSYFDATIQHFIHYATGTFLLHELRKMQKKWGLSRTYKWWCFNNWRSGFTNKTTSDEERKKKKKRKSIMI